MIIGIDASRANQPKKTGVGWYSYYLIEELKKIITDNQNQFFLYTHQPLRGDLARLPQNWQEKILDWWPKYLWTKIRFSWEMLRRKPDVLFIPSHVMPKFSPKKTVMTVHDLGYERYPEVYSKFARNYLRKNYRFAAQHAVKIITPTEFTKKELISLYHIKSEKVEIVSMAYNDKIFRKIDDNKKINDVLKKYKIKKPYLLFVGRLETKKGLQTLLKAFTLIPNNLITNNSITLNLVLAGGRGYGYKDLKPLISDLKSVKELGYLKNESDRAVLYNAAEIFVFPSLYEGFGIPLLEAMACGTPVIASNIETLKEVGGDSAQFFKVGEAEDLAKKIKEVLEDHELRQKMIRRGSEHVKNFSWQKCAEKTLKILENL